jgi:hypothetical protein
MQLTLLMHASMWLHKKKMMHHFFKKKRKKSSTSYPAAMGGFDRPPGSGEGAGCICKKK